MNNYFLFSPRFKTPRQIFIFLVLVVFILRLPFISAGPGTDPDAWRLINAAKQINSTGAYHASRLPGYPVIEMLLAIAFRVTDSISILSLLAVVSSAMAAGFFSLICIRLRISSPIGLAMAFSFTPVIAINAAGTMDYLPALMFILASIYFILSGKNYAAGLMLGIAIGCRITSVIFIIPLVIVLVRRKKSFFAPIFFTVATFITGTVCYLPVVYRYGLHFFSFIEMGESSGWMTFMRSLIGVWGAAGSLLAFIVLILIIRSAVLRRRGAKFDVCEGETLLIAVIGIVLEVILYLRLPNDPAYLIPAVPLFWLLAGKFIEKKIHFLMAAGMIASSLFFSIETIDREWSMKPSRVSVPIHIGGMELVVDVLQGPLIADYIKKREMMKYVHCLSTQAEITVPRSLIVAGVWFPQIVVMKDGVFPPDATDDFVYDDGKVLFVGLLRPETAEGFSRRGVHIFYIPGQEKYNKNVWGIELKEFGGREIGRGL